MQLGKMLEAKVQMVLEDRRKVTTQGLLLEVAERSGWLSLGLVVASRSAPSIEVSVSFSPHWTVLKSSLKFHLNMASPRSPSGPPQGTSPGSADYFYVLLLPQC